MTSQDGNAMAIDANPATAAVEGSTTQPVGAPFALSVNITTVGNDYSSYGYRLDISDTLKIQFTAATDLNPDVDSDTSADFLNCSTPSVTPGSVQGFCGNSFETFFTGQMSQVTIECLDTGQHAVDLSDVTVDPSAGTTTVDPNGNIDTVTTGAQVECQGGGGPAPTATATPVGDATPAATPIGPVATPTPLPPGFEAVPLFGGCQFEAWTGADGTPPGELAGLAGPAGNLRSLWAQQPPPSWKGYSPAFPDVSDMGPVNLLDVVAICTTGPGDFVRPVL